MPLQEHKHTTRMLMWLLIRAMALAVCHTVWSDVVPAEIRDRGWLVSSPGWFVGLPSWLF